MWFLYVHLCTNHLTTGLFTKQRRTTGTVSRIFFNIHVRRWKATSQVFLALWSQGNNKIITSSWQGLLLNSMTHRYFNRFVMSKSSRSSLRGRPLRGRKVKMSTGGRRNGLQGRYCFLCFFRPPDERKNPDWSDSTNFSHRFAICYF